MEGSVLGSRKEAGDARPSPDRPRLEPATTRTGDDMGGRSHAAGIAWLGWFSGIIASWIGWGVVAAAGWWLLYWPVVLILVLLYLYSPLSPESGRRSNSSPPDAPSPLGSLMLQRPPPSVGHERAPRRRARLVANDSQAC